MNEVYQFFQTNSSEILLAVVISVATFIVFYVVKQYIYSLLRKRDNIELLDALADRIEQIGFVTASITAAYLVSIIISQTPKGIQTFFYFLFILGWTWQAIMLISRMIDFSAKRYLQRQSGETSNEAVIRFVASSTKVIAWIVAGLLILSNLGYDVNSLVAGLGIGGLAVALAVQTILGDLLSSFSIVVDKPFKTNDFIIVDDLMGTVEKIGIRSTRIVSIDGEEIIMPNSELTSSNIRNFGRVQKRRGLHKLGILYDTDPALVPEVPEMVKMILRENKRIEKDTFRVHLIEFGDSSITFEVHFYVTTYDYNEFLDVQQEILLAIKEKFESEGIEFAYPTQTVFINNSNSTQQ